jgi:hypothetical protein
MEKNGLLLCELICKPQYTNAIELYLYDSKENMYKGTHEWNNKNKYSINNDFDAITLENLPNTIKTVENTEYQIFSTIFLNTEYLNQGIILHECGHATFILFRNILRFDGNFKRVNGSGDDEEEIFCYTQEEFFNKIIKILKKEKIEF